MTAARFGFTINKTQQKVIAAYLLVVIVMLLWRIDAHLEQVAAQQHRQQIRESKRRDQEPYGPAGLPDRDDGDDVVDEPVGDDQDAIDNAIEELEEDGLCRSEEELNERYGPVEEPEG